MNENENPMPNPNQQNNNQEMPTQPAYQATPVSASPTVTLNQGLAGESPDQPTVTPATPSPQTTTESRRSTFSGRIGRLGYLIGHVYILLANMALLITIFLIMPAMSFLEDSPLRMIINIPLFLIVIVIVALTFLASISLIVRRQHDLGHPWFWILLSFIPLVGFIYSFYLLLMPGKKESNQWGEPVTSLNFFTVLGLK